MRTLQVGDVVDYHAVIGGDVTSTNHVITHIKLEPNHFGCPVAWVTRIAGCVAMAALSPSQKELHEPLLY